MSKKSKRCWWNRVNARLQYRDISLRINRSAVISLLHSTLTQSASAVIIIQFIFFKRYLLHLRLFFTLGGLFIKFLAKCFRNYALIVSRAAIFCSIYRPTFHSPSLIKRIRVLEFYQIFFFFFRKGDNNENDSSIMNRNVIKYTENCICIYYMYIYIILYFALTRISLSIYVYRYRIDTFFI